jgi:predicted dehydrogenase
MVAIDYVHYVLGEYQTSNAHLQIQRPNQTIRHSDGTETPFTSDVPDLVSIHGTLKESEHVVSGASLLVKFQTGPPFQGTSPFTWTITGEKGRIQMSCERGPMIHAEGSGFPIPILWEDFVSGEVKKIPWEFEDWQKSLPPVARNTAKQYDLFAEGNRDSPGLVDFEEAVVRHAQFDEMLYSR